MTIPNPIVDISNFGGTALWGTLASDLVADGWVVIFPPYQEDFYVGFDASVGITNDISADTNHGARYLASTLHWWDHVLSWINSNYGAWPIVPFGASWGGWRAFSIAANRPSTITSPQ